MWTGPHVGVEVQVIFISHGVSLQGLSVLTRFSVGVGKISRRDKSIRSTSASRGPIGLAIRSTIRGARCGRGALNWRKRALNFAAASLSLAYDPLGRLQQTTAGTTTTQLLYDGDRLVAEYDPSRPANDQLLRRYVHGPGVDEPLVWYQCANPPGTCLTDRRYLITDHQGSVIAENGASTVRYAYGPYGEPNTWTGSRFRYTGQIALPEVGLYHYKARVYWAEGGGSCKLTPSGIRRISTSTPILATTR